MRKGNALCIVALAVLIAVGFFSPTNTAATSKKYLSLGTGNPGGTGYFMGAGFASIFNKYVPGVRVIAESTGGTDENFNLVWRKKIDLGITSCNPLRRAAEKNTDLSHLRLLAMGHTSDHHWFVRKESPVSGIADYRGRKISVGQPGSGTLLMSQWILDACGVSWKDIKPAYLSFTESVTGIRDGTVDVGVLSAGYPAASLLDLSRQIPMRLIPYTPNELGAVFMKLPYMVKIIIPAKIYTGIATDTVTIGSPSYLLCRSDLNEDLGYQFIKALYEHPKERDAIHPQSKQWSPDTIFRGADYVLQHFPFHPGVVKYLKEKGLWARKE